MGPPFRNPSRLTLAAWSLLALLNLGSGLVISAQPDRLTDLETMTRWTRAWLSDGTNVYGEVEGGIVDYPPNAIVLLSPLGLLSGNRAAPAWLLLNVVLICLAPYVAARVVRPEMPLRVIVLPIAMFLCWGGVRTLAQFTVVPLTLSMAALLCADRRSLVAGVWLGLAMMKPQVAAPVFLWSLFARRWRVSVSAVLVAVGLAGVYSLWAGVGDLRLLTTQYLGNLAVYHAGDALLLGASELRPLILQAARHSPQVDVVVVATGAVLLAIVCILSFREGTRRGSPLYAAPPLAACAVLLTVYHLTYGFLILLPALMALALVESRSPILQRRVFWLLQIGMMFDVPGISRRAGLGGTWLYDSALAHVDRVLMVALFTGLAVLAWRNNAPASSTAAEATS